MNIDNQNMEKIHLNGITWEHRRAIDPLVKTADLFSQIRPDIVINWDKQPLSGFEFTPVSELAKKYDFLILDNPFCGAIEAERSLIPLNDIVGNIENNLVGPSVASFRFGDSIWALPVDAATQVQVVRPDLLDRTGFDVPKDWQEMIALGSEVRKRGLYFAIGLSGVHSLMTFFTLMANLGHPCASSPEQSFCDQEAAGEVLSLLREFLQFCPTEVLDWNTIKLHEAMAEGDNLVLCPAVYGYATYAEKDQKHQLEFHDFPGPNGPAGTTLGGAGLGVSASCQHVEAALDYVRFAAQADTQIAFTHHHGQPARVEAWESPNADATFQSYCRNTRMTHNKAWIRPRYNGYMSFQAKAGNMIESHLRGEHSSSAIIDQLTTLHCQSSVA